MGAAAISWGLEGNSPWAMATLPLGRDFVFPLLKIDTSHWLGLPLLWTATLGTLGLLATVLGAWHISNRTYRHLITSYAIGLIVGGLALHYLVTGLELRRFFAMSACVLGAFFVTSALPSPRLWFDRIKPRCNVVYGGCITILQRQT